MAYGLSSSFNRLIGSRIRARRKALGLSLEDVAFKIGTKKNRVCSLEMGHETPTLEKLYRVADALSCTVHDFLPKSAKK